MPTGSPGRTKASTTAADAAGMASCPVIESKDAEIAALRSRAIELEIRCRAAEEKISRIRAALEENQN